MLLFYCIPTAVSIATFYCILIRVVSRAAIALMLTCVACGGDRPRAGHTLDDIKARGEITWGADLQGGEPYVYEDPASPNHIIGFEVDIMDAVARRLGVKARMVQY